MSSASARAGGVAAVRLALGVAFIVGSMLRGLGGGPAVLGALAGALVLAVIALGQRGRGRGAGFHDAVPVPPNARFDPGWVGVLVACVPSTVGVSAMAVLALVASPALAAVLGGVLIALGALAVATWAQLTAREQRERTRYWLERGPRPGLFTAPRGNRRAVDTTTPRSRDRA